MAAPAPAPRPVVVQPPAQPTVVNLPPTGNVPPSTGERWALRVFLILFFLTLIIGLLQFLFSYLKFRS